MVLLHFALVRCHLDYGDQLWVPSVKEGKVRSGAPEEPWTGVNHVLVTDILAQL